MKELLRKLNYKGQKRIAVLNSAELFLKDLHEALEGVIIDTEIDQRCPYEFMIIFVKNRTEVKQTAPVALHNLTADGILWFCYRKKSSLKFRTDLERDNGWEVLQEAGFYGIRMVSIDDEWSALRFRNRKFIKSKSGRIPT